MIDKTLKLGVVYTRRDLIGEYFMNLETAKKSKEAIEKKLKELNISYVNIDFLNEEGMIYSGRHRW